MTNRPASRAVLDQRSQPEDRRAPRGVQILHDPRLNKGTAFTEVEWDLLGLRGLLPPRVFTQEEQELRVLANLRRLHSPLDQYLSLVALLDRNERLFYRTVVDNLAELLPILYTPTVGEACRQFGLIFSPATGTLCVGEGSGSGPRHPSELAGAPGEGRGGHRRGANPGTG